MAGTGKEIRFRGLEAWCAGRETGGAGTCHLGRTWGRPPARLLLGASVCRAAPPNLKPFLCRPVWVNGDTVNSHLTPCPGRSGGSPVVVITIIKKTNKQIHLKSLVFALFWAFPQLPPAQPSLRDPPLGRWEARAVPYLQTLGSGQPVCSGSQGPAVWWGPGLGGTGTHWSPTLFLL